MDWDSAAGDVLAAMQLAAWVPTTRASADLDGWSKEVSDKLIVKGIDAVLVANGVKKKFERKAKKIERMIRAAAGDDSMA